MCHFITAGVPAKHRDAIESLGRGRHALGIEPVKNPSVLRLFPAGDAVYVVTHGGCSCDIFSEPTQTTAAEDEAAERARYRRKGWSEAKIARAIEAKMKPDIVRARESRQKFQDAIATVVKRVGRVRLLAHWYDGDIHTEQVEAEDPVTLPLTEFTRGAGAFPPDRIVEVTSDGG